jgi:hypothetical protein
MRTQAIKDSEPSSDLDTRLANLDAYFTYFLYKMVCRSLFEKDKLLFSFLLCTRMMRALGTLSSEDFRFLLTGGIAVTKPPPNPFDSWLAEKSWGEISRMSELSHMQGFVEDFVKHESGWRELFESGEPYKADFPGDSIWRGLRTPPCHSQHPPRQIGAGRDDVCVQNNGTEIHRTATVQPGGLLRGLEPMLALNFCLVAWS